MNILIGGITNGSSAERLHAAVAAADGSLILASAPSAGYREVPDSLCLDLTACVDDAASALLRSSPPPMRLVLVRDHQLQDEGLTGLLRCLGLAAVVINTDSSHDTDPAWVVSQFRWAASRVEIAFFALDIFPDAGSSWESLLDASEDEFNVRDLERICQDFPIVLSANFDSENIGAIAGFRGARGIFITCDELKPILPPERHSMSVETALQVLAHLAGGQPRG